MQHMLDNIPCMFDCWADPFVHLFVLRSSIYKHNSGQRFSLGAEADAVYDKDSHVYKLFLLEHVCC